MADLLMATPLSNEQREYAETMEHSGQALLRIIDDILDFSKIEAGKVEIRRTPFRLKKILNQVLVPMDEEAKSKGLGLTTRISADLPEVVRGDSERLAQVLSNLISNAIKFTASGEIIVSAALAEHTDGGARLRFEVKDTGIGIPAEAQKLIFQSFAQADGSTTRKHGGTGLGLAISKQLVEMMGGEIGVDSEPGEGSLFWFTVRLDTATAAEITR